MTKFSIIIPVRQINDFLRENISAIKKLDYSNYEVLIIVDDAETFEFADNRFKLLISGKLGPGEKRNIGAAQATGDVLVFLDDDAYPTPNWLTHAAKIFEDPQIYALGGPAMTPPNAPFSEKISGKILESPLASGNTTYRHKPTIQQEIADYPSVNLFIRKEAFNKVGGFPIKFWPGEDTKICLDLVNLYGRKFLYSPLLVVYHHRRAGIKAHLKQVSRYGQHRGQFARIFPETSRLPSYFVPSLFVLGLFLGPIVCSLLPILWRVYFSVVTLYLVLLTLEGVKIYVHAHAFKEALHVAVGIFLTHIVYGLNFIVGFIKQPKLKLKSVDTKTGNYNEG